MASVGLLSAAQFVALVVHIASGGMGEGGAEAGGPGSDRDLTTVPVGASAVPEERSVEAYAGYGAWVDVYDYVPAMQGSGQGPEVTPDDVDEMADQGVRTLYLQAANDHARTPGPVVDESLVGEFLTRAHERDVRVVGWYVPRFASVARDLAFLEGISSFEVDGHRFDGVAVDIEWTRSVPNARERSERLVELSTQLRGEVGDDPLGAIVLPPVQLEDVNRRMWPGFPWEELAPLYDVWLPMGYWTDRRASSGWRDASRYTVENAARVRSNLGDEDAVVHVIGGIGHDATASDLTRFVAAAVDAEAFGASVYDWASLSRDERGHLRDVVDEAVTG